MKRHPVALNETYSLAERFLRVFQSLVRLTDEQAPDIGVEQLNVNQLLALDLIYREPGISQKAVAEQLDVTSASVSINVAKMLELKLVEKHPDEEDGRFMRLYLSPDGQELVKKIETAQIAVIAELLNGLPLEEQQTVVEALERALVARSQALRTAHDAAIVE